MSLSYFEAWRGALPEGLRPLALYGAKERPKERGPVRFVWIPAEDSFSFDRTFREPGVLFTRRAGVSVEIAAPDYASIEGAGGLLDVALSAIAAVAPGRFDFGPSGWLRTEESAATSRGVVYVLGLVLSCPVLKTPAETWVQPESLDLSGEVGEP